MPANIIGHSTHVERPLTASIKGRRATTGPVRTILTWFSRIVETCAQWAFAMEPWQLGTLDMPEFRQLSAVERSASIAQLKNAACPIQRTHCVMIYNDDGTGGRTFTFEESAMLFDAPVGIAADTILGHLAAADRPGDPLSYRIAEATRHGDMLMIKGTLPACRGELDFIAVAFAA